MWQNDMNVYRNHNIFAQDGLSSSEQNWSLVHIRQNCEIQVAITFIILFYLVAEKCFHTI